MRCRAVARLHGGQFNTDTLYLPDQRIIGVAVIPDDVTVGVVGRYPATVAVSCGLAPLPPGRPAGAHRRALLAFGVVLLVARCCRASRRCCPWAAGEGGAAAGVGHRGLVRDLAGHARRTDGITAAQVSVSARPIRVTARALPPTTVIGGRSLRTSVGEPARG